MFGKKKEFKLQPITETTGFLYDGMLFNTKEEALDAQRTDIVRHYGKREGKGYEYYDTDTIAKNIDKAYNKIKELEAKETKVEPKLEGPFYV